MTTHFVTIGVCGCGKATITLSSQKYLDQRPYAEGDDFHTQTNRDKMGVDISLTDEDHHPWLGSLCNWMTEQAKNGEKYPTATCFVLKRHYRDILRGVEGKVAFIHPTPPQVINPERIPSRQGYYMKAGMLDSQLEILEELGADECGVKIDNPGSPEAIEADAVNWVRAQGLIQ